MKIDSIAILDCGGQYTKVIDRRIRELQVRSEIFSISTEAAQLKEYNGIIFSGGPASIWSDSRPPYDPRIFELGIPCLGICYGLHLINTHFGGLVKPGIKQEYGETEILLDPACPLFTDLEPSQKVLMSHGDSVATLAAGFEAAGNSGPIVAAIYNRERKIYAVQFHPEVDLTVEGKKILDNFLKKICGLTGNYRLEDRIETAIAKIRQQVGRAKIIVLVSGGVDSAVSAVLLLKALKPSQIIAIHVDHGLMRKNESDRIIQNLKKLGLSDVIRIDAQEVFFNATAEHEGRTIGPLTSIYLPEEKRQIIGDLFIRVIREKAGQLNIDFDTTFLAQGTLRPDLIESGNPAVSSHAHKIKTHHNDVDIIRQAREQGLIVETNWDWHKDEVRQIARRLGIDEAIAARQPFPGPGLAIRCICGDGKEQISSSQQQQFDQLFKRLHTEANLFAALLPVRTVGVQGDCRSYRYLALLGGEGIDGDWQTIYRLGNLIPNQLDFVNRVAYILNRQKLTSPLRVTDLRITTAGVRLLQDVDELTRYYLDIPQINQTFAVLLPLVSAGSERKSYSIAIRTFVTNDYMTGRPAVMGGDIDKNIMQQLVADIEHEFPAIDLIVYDITAKPPATVEWE